MANDSRLKTWGMLALVLGAGAAGASCGDVVRQGRGSSYVIIDALVGANGADPSAYSTTVQSDVVTLVRRQINGQTVLVPTIFEDGGKVAMTLAQKDITTTASTNNYVTITRYRVTYRRSDGRNVPGVDVPYPFDGAATFTVTPGGVEFPFLLVRSQAKAESPLVQLGDIGTSFAITTLAEVTFYGTDQAGNEIAVTGQIGINFANWGDPN